MAVGNNECAELRAPDVVMPCVSDPCADVYWLANSTWSACSEPCDAGSGDSARLGVSTSPPALCMAMQPDGSFAAVDDIMCFPLVRERMHAVCVCVRACVFVFVQGTAT